MRRVLCSVDLLVVVLHSEFFSFITVVLNTQAKFAKLTTPPYNSLRNSKISSQI